MKKASFDNKIILYVDATANPCGDGTSNAPLRSLTEARDKIRTLRADGCSSAVDVMVLPGEYSPLLLEDIDSGAENAPVRYISTEKCKAAIKGSITVPAGLFSPIDGSEAEEIIAPDAKENVVKLSLSSLGLTEEEYGSDVPARVPFNSPSAELFSGVKRLPQSRYPKEGWMLINKLNQNPDGTVSNSCPCSDDLVERSLRWKRNPSPYSFGYYKYHWSDSTSLFSFDREKKEVTFTDIKENGLDKGMRYCFYNIFEELSSPGDNYIDREKGVLYLYSSPELMSSSFELSLNIDPLIEIKNASYISFIGFSVCYGRNVLIKAEGSCLTFSDMHLFGAGNHGMEIRGSDITVSDSEIEETGGCGIVAAGGDRETLTPSNILICDNRIHDFARIKTCYCPAVEMYTCGCTVTHNEIYHSTHAGVIFHGPLNVIEYNRFYDLCYETSDCGAIYSGRTMFYYGTVIRYNYIRDIGCHDVDDDFFCAQGIYLDDGLSGQTVYGNIVENVTGRGIYLGGGRDNIAVNNIIINPGIYSIDPDDRMRDAAFFDGWFSKTHLKVMSEDIMALLNDTWIEKFPVFKKMKFDYITGDENDPDLFVIPANNVIKNNISYKCGQSEKFPVGKFCFEAISDFSEMHHNYIIENEGGDVSDFYDFEGGDRTLRDDSVARRLLPDFDIIPFDSIGIRKKR
ncbi:MAG: right-handed parallel beta-helix repeat-containing protein [Clostridia bacterium]|nr:right-handed parallel beta-helix repeat-containing protein [Clostridia bacterium]